MIRWLRVTWPPGWALAMAFFVYAGFEGFFLLMERAIGLPHYELVEAKRVSVGVTGVMLAFFGIFRVWAFHPGFRTDYAQWLSMTVWTARKRLPLGPVHFVWQDALLLAIAIGLCWPRGQELTAAALGGFALGYLGCLAIANGATGEKHWSYVFSFYCGVMVLLWNRPWMLAAGAVVGYGIVYCGMRRSLWRFPWDNTVGKQMFDVLQGQKINDRRIGWPYDHLGPKFSDISAIGQADSLAVSCLVGWGVFVISTLFREAQEYKATGAFFICLTLVGFGSTGRLIVYCVNYLPPVEFSARPFPWFIIPGYDQVLVAPFAAIGVCCLINEVARWLEADRYYVMPFAVVAAFWILMGMGPSLKVWRLTGQHRITPGVQSPAMTQ